MALSTLGYRKRRAIEKALIDERARIARDLHDGLAQELAFISMRSWLLAEAETGGRAAGDLADAADRALHEVRRAIDFLIRPPGQALDAAVSETASRLTERSAASLDLDLDPSATLAPECHHDLLRILGEAVSNALRHGRATAIAVKLSQGAGLRLRIADNGVGFDPDAVTAASAFGLRSMRVRARAIGGELQVRSRPNCGTEVEVVLP
jgi:signal transduction histidine kinase